MNRQDLFKTVPNYMGKTMYGKCGAGFNARLGGGISIAKGETEAEILANAKKILITNCHQWFETLPENICELAVINTSPSVLMEEADSTQEALMGSFSWDRTPQGFDFWCEVYDTIESKKSLSKLEAKAKKYLKQMKHGK